MNALKGFKYEHKEKVVVNSSLGKIELTYIVREKDLAEQPFFKAGLISEFLPSDNPILNERTYFQAHLIDGMTNRIVCTGYGINPETAIEDVYKIYATNLAAREIENM